MEKRQISMIAFTGILILGLSSCRTSGNQHNAEHIDPGTVVDVEAGYFTAANPNLEITTVSCTLSDGTKTQCYQIVTNSAPADHPMGPWCPDNISDEADAGGLWIENGEVYDVDGDFIKNLATLYNDDGWKMYDAEGNVYVTETEEDCLNAANPNVGEEYNNYCVECLPSYISEVSRTWLIPVRPVLLASSASFNRGGRGPGGPGDDAGRPERPGDQAGRPDRPERRPPGPPPGIPGGPGAAAGGIPATRGIALNGVEFSAPAPVNNILGAYTIAPFDDAGGHINVHQGYHYHLATGLSYSVAQADGHAPLIGYAMDGHGIYGRLDEAGNEASDLDDCRGHYDDIRGYHYHVDAPGNNNFINCLRGAYPNS